MSDISNRLEWLARVYCIDVLVLQEWFNERLSIMQSDNIPDAERMALEDVERELEGRS